MANVKGDGKYRVKSLRTICNFKSILLEGCEVIVTLLF